MNGRSDRCCSYRSVTKVSFRWTTALVLACCLGGHALVSRVLAQDNQAAAPIETSPSPPPLPQTVPDLLPESRTLPPLPPDSALPPDLIPQRPPPIKAAPLPNPGSFEQQEKDRIRLRQLRTIAAKDPFAIYLAGRALIAKTEESKREYLRAYYISMAIQMRRIEPRLKSLIDAFEAGQVGLVSPRLIRPTIPLRDLPRFEKQQQKELKAAEFSAW
jgi:hypothetical protein